MLNRNQILTLTALASLVAAVSYGAATYQRPYGCGGSSVTVVQGRPSQGSGIDWQVLTHACFYIYFVGIVGGSIFLILLIPVNREKPNETVQNTKP